MKKAGIEKPEFISSISGIKDGLGKILIDHELYKKDDESETT